MASLDFCPVVLQLAWLFNSPACSTRVQLLAASKLRASHEIQPQVPASLHNLKHFFTLSHTLPLHDSHINTGFLSAVLQANLSRNKANTWLIKFNLTEWSLTSDNYHVLATWFLAYLHRHWLAVFFFEQNRNPRKHKQSSKTPTPTMRPTIRPVLFLLLLGGPLLTVGVTGNSIQK